MWAKIVKFGIGLILIPLCMAATRTAFFLLMSVRPQSASALTASVWGFFIGFGLWVILFHSLSVPVKTYVFGHEMTHAIWGFLLGARVSGLKVGDEGGSVMVSKPNFIIVLAPYCFPFYSFAVLILYAALSAFTDLNTYKPFWMGLLGLTWSFHITFTLRMLQEHQSDIASQGRLFSYAFIYLVNLVLICLLILAMGNPTLKLFLSHFTNEIIDAFQYFSNIFSQIYDFAMDRLQ